MKQAESAARLDRVAEQHDQVLAALELLLDRTERALVDFGAAAKGPENARRPTFGDSAEPRTARVQ